MDTQETLKIPSIEELAIDPQRIPVIGKLVDGTPLEHGCSCHCGAIRYTVRAPSLQEPATQPVTACNCSICVKSGSLFIYPPVSAVEWITGFPGKIRRYQVGRKVFDHLQCGSCGSHLGIDFKGKYPGGGDVMAVNVRMVHNIDVEKLDVRGIRGRDMLPNLNRDF